MLELDKQNPGVDSTLDSPSSLKTEAEWTNLKLSFYAKGNFKFFKISLKIVTTLDFLSRHSRDRKMYLTMLH